MTPYETCWHFLDYDLNPSVLSYYSTLCLDPQWSWQMTGSRPDSDGIIQSAIIDVVCLHIFGYVWHCFPGNLFVDLSLWLWHSSDLFCQKEPDSCYSRGRGSMFPLIIPMFIALLMLQDMMIYLAYLASKADLLDPLKCIGDPGHKVWVSKSKKRLNLSLQAFHNSRMSEGKLIATQSTETIQRGFSCSYMFLLHSLRPFLNCPLSILKVTIVLWCNRIAYKYIL